MLVLTSENKYEQIESLFPIIILLRLAHVAPTGPCSHARRRGSLPAVAKKLVAVVHERAVKTLDICSVVHDGFDQVRRFERLADIVTSALLVLGEIHEGQLRRANKEISDLSVLLVYDTTTATPRTRWRTSSVPSMQLLVARQRVAVAPSSWSQTCLK